MPAPDFHAGSASHFNRLSPKYAEQLAILLEELGEAAQAAGKVLRHGYHSYDPTVPEAERVLNVQALERELGHVMFAVWMLTDLGPLSNEAVTWHAAEKAKSVRQWTHHQNWETET